LKISKEIPMTDVEQTVSTPAASTSLANGLEKLFLDLVAAKKAGASGLALLTEAVSLAVADLEPALAGVAGVGAEVAAEPVGVAESFALAGFGVARALTGK
jgi:hypothetical protein